ncbi:unnamed protein product [Hymenolepis diminuta]|uniref:Deacetylase sirtuin-type domain-containing protein n=1 Tax=Hymenolepis diminuta TaxID=6216 RepID=A0A0R3SJ57_HYMDI|nr:unnamed protein product [Hymenolepis diminuta]
MWKNPELLGSLISAGYRNPRLLLTRLFKIAPEYLPSDPCEPELWRILSSLFAEKSSRKPLKQYHSLQAAIDLLKEKSKILVLTGAGISVSCGIPDFRSRNGIYARFERDFPDLRNPQDMFDLKFFKSNPNPFYTFAKELFPGQFKPSYTHRFIRLLEKKSKLLRNYTQNIDTLEEIAGISKIIHCHGSFSTASCLTCYHQLPGEELREPEVGECAPLLGLMKPDIVFFSESLPQEFHYTLDKDVRDVDLVLVMGSSLKVRPVSHIPNSVPHHVPQILINREPLSNHQFDIELLGDCDVVVEYLCKELGWHIDMDDANWESVSSPYHSAATFVTLCPQLFTERIIVNHQQKKTVSAFSIVDISLLCLVTFVFFPLERHSFLTTGTFTVLIPKSCFSIIIIRRQLNISTNFDKVYT